MTVDSMGSCIALAIYSVINGRTNSCRTVLLSPLAAEVASLPGSLLSSSAWGMFPLLYTIMHLQPSLAVTEMIMFCLMTLACWDIILWWLKEHECGALVEWCWLEKTEGFWERKMHYISLTDWSDIKCELPQWKWDATIDLHQKCQ